MPDTITQQMKETTGGIIKATGAGTTLYGALQLTQYVPHMSGEIQKLSGIAQLVNEAAAKVMPTTGPDLPVSLEIALASYAGYNFNKSPAKSACALGLSTTIPLAKSFFDEKSSFLWSTQGAYLTTGEILMTAIISFAAGFIAKYATKGKQDAGGRSFERE